MSRDKLQRLGIHLPLLPITAVGSFPKSKELKSARAKLAKEGITAQEMESLEWKATNEWVQFQKDLGVDVLVDGEMYRGDMVTYFAERMEGFAISGLVRSYGNRFYKKPIIKSPLRWKGPITVDWWKRAQELSEAPMKAVLTGPYTVMDWSFNEHYPDRRTTCLAIAAEIRKEVEALISVGAKLIQIDEPALSVRPVELPLAIEAMGRVTHGLDAYFLTHICYGDFSPVYPDLLKLPVDNFDLELANSNFEMIEFFKKDPFTKDITIGVVDVHTHKMESVEAIREGIQRTLEVIPPKQVWIDPDCGLKTRNADEAKQKMELIVQAVGGLRNELNRPTQPANPEVAPSSEVVQPEIEEPEQQKVEPEPDPLSE